MDGLMELPACIIRHLLLNCMDSDARRAMRGACKRMRDIVDEHASTRSLSWAGLHGSDACLSALPQRLLTGDLHALSCAGLKRLHSLHGLPPGLRALDLGACTGIKDYSPLLACTQLQRLCITAYKPSLLQPPPKPMSCRGLVARLHPRAWFGSHAPTPLGPAIAALPTLQHLDVTGTKHETDGASLAHILACHPTLQHLTLCSVRMTPADAHLVAQALVGLTNLRGLALTSRTLHHSLLGPLSSHTTALTALTRLDLRNNKLATRRGGLSLLVAALAPLRGLQQLILRETNLFMPFEFDGSDIDALFVTLSTLTALTTLDLGHTGLGITRLCGLPYCEQQLAEALAAMRHLRTLDLSGNCACSGLLLALAPAFRNLDALEDLDLSDNAHRIGSWLDGEDWEGAWGEAVAEILSLPLPSLKRLHMNKSFVTADFLGWLPRVCEACLSRSHVPLLSVDHHRGPQEVQQIVDALQALPVLP